MFSFVVRTEFIHALASRRANRTLRKASAFAVSTGLCCAVVRICAGVAGWCWGAHSIGRIGRAALAKSRIAVTVLAATIAL